MVALLLVAACTPAKLQLGDSAAVDPIVDDTPVDTDTTEHLDTDITDTDTTETDTDTEPDTWPKACADIYDPDILPTFSLTFTESDLRSLRSNFLSSTA